MASKSAALVEMSDALPPPWVKARIQLLLPIAFALLGAPEASFAKIDKHCCAKPDKSEK